MTPLKIPIISECFLQADVVPRGSVFLVLLRKLEQRCTNFHCTNVASRRQKRFRSLYFRAQSVTWVTETIAVRKYSTQWGVLDQEGIMPLLSHPHERTDLKHHHGFILALVCMWIALAVASAVVFAGFCLSLAK